MKVRGAEKERDRRGERLRLQGGRCRLSAQITKASPDTGSELWRARQKGGRAWRSGAVTSHGLARTAMCPRSSAFRERRRPRLDVKMRPLIVCRPLLGPEAGKGVFQALETLRLPRDPHHVHPEAQRGDRKQFLSLLSNFSRPSPLPGASLHQTGERGVSSPCPGGSPARGLWPLRGWGGRTRAAPPSVQGPGYGRLSSGRPAGSLGQCSKGVSVSRLADSRQEPRGASGQLAQGQGGLLRTHRAREAPGAVGGGRVWFSCQKAPWRPSGSV